MAAIDPSDDIKRLKEREDNPLFDFSSIKHHRTPRPAPSPRKSRTLFNGAGVKVDEGGSPPGWGSIWKNLDGSISLTGFLGFVSSPIPALIAFFRLIPLQQRGVLGAVVAFTAFILATPVYLTSQPYPGRGDDPVFTWLMLAPLPILIAMMQVNNAYALKVRVFLFWLTVFAYVAKYGVFITYGYW